LCSLHCLLCICAARWGTPVLAERALHDLFSNVRSLAPALPRLRLFAALAGCLPPPRSPHLAGDVELRDDGECSLQLRISQCAIRTTNYTCRRCTHLLCLSVYALVDMGCEPPAASALTTPTPTPTTTASSTSTTRPRRVLLHQGGAGAQLAAQALRGRRRRHRRRCCTR
jgi:hypothetical protein